MKNVEGNFLVIVSREAAKISPSFASSRLRVSILAVRPLAMTALLLFIATCAFAKTPPPPKLPEWKAVPASVLDSFCSNFREEGISSSTTINVVKTAQKFLITPASMQALSESGFYHGSMDSAKAASAALAASDEIPVTMPNDCAWRPIEPKSAARYTDTMTLEISPPIANPFSRNSTGLFARLTLGGEASTWYWLPLIPRGETWTAGRMAVLPYRQ